MAESKLTFRALRGANLMRLPRFPGHNVKDGHCADWTRSDWLEACVGELGEYANWSKKFRRGDITEEEFLAHARKEFADVVTYLDLLAAKLGIDLGQAVEDKFNEVSNRIGVHIVLSGDAGVVLD